MHLAYRCIQGGVPTRIALNCVGLHRPLALSFSCVPFILSALTRFSLLRLFIVPLLRLPLSTTHAHALSLQEPRISFLPDPLGFLIHQALLLEPPPPPHTLSFCVFALVIVFLLLFSLLTLS